MITVSDLTLAYSGQPLFSHVDLQFIQTVRLSWMRLQPKPKWSPFTKIR